MSFVVFSFCGCCMCHANELSSLLYCTLQPQKNHTDVGCYSFHVHRLISTIFGRIVVLYRVIVAVIVRWRTARPVVVFLSPSWRFAGRMRWSLAILVAKDFFISWTLLWFVVATVILTLTLWSFLHFLFCPQFAMAVGAWSGGLGR